MVTNWGAFLQGLAKTLIKAAADVKGNVAPPKPTAVAPSLDAQLSDLQNLLSVINTFRKARPGVVTGADDIMKFLADQGVPNTLVLYDLMISIPGDLDEAEKWLPWLISMSKEFTPAATGIQGDGRSTMWHNS